MWPELKCPKTLIFFFFKPPMGFPGLPLERELEDAAVENP